MLHELLPRRSAGRSRSMPAIQCNNIYVYMYLMHRSLPVMRRSSCPRIASPINSVSCAAWMKETCSRHASSQYPQRCPKDTRLAPLLSLASYLHALAHSSHADQVAFAPRDQGCKVRRFPLRGYCFVSMRRPLPPPIITLSSCSRLADGIALCTSHF